MKTIEHEGQQLTVAEPAPVPVVSESAAILSVIERAARDPGVDVDKMERLMAMHERMMARSAKAAYNAALAEVQPKLPAITEKGEINHNGRIISKYALWEDVVQAITPVLAAHGFALSFRLGREPDRQIIKGILSHRDGHSEETEMSLPLDMSGAKNPVQGVGSTVSYGKRYVTQALLNLVSRGEDDDAQGGGRDTITDEQKAELVALMQETGADTAGFLKYMGVAALDESKAAAFGKAKTGLEAKRRKAKTDA